MANRSPRSRASAPQAARFSKSFCALAGAAALGGVIGCAPPGDEFESITQPGLAYNGLAYNGATSPDFANWFNLADGGDIALHDMSMRYLIRCAFSAGRTATFTDKDGLVHSWPGALGLADSWDQNPPTADQQKWVSACLMAHVNSALPAPKSIQISLRGSAPSLAGAMLEKGVISTFDGVFFGDLFGSTQKRYICSPTWTPPANYVQTLLADWGRQCFFSADGCGGMFTPVNCNTACTPAPAGADYLYGPTCTVDGVTYNAINAYVPRFKKAQDFQRVGTQLATCSGCLDGRALDNFTSSTYAQVGGWTNGTGGAVFLDVRYRSTTGATQNLRLQVNGAYVMNGSSQNWSFAPTGSGAGIRSIPVTLPAGSPTVKLMGPASGKGPKVEVVSLRVQ